MELRKYLLPSILFILLPIAYAANPYVFLSLLATDILLFLKIKTDHGAKVFFIYLIGFTFFGVSIFGIKIYDIILLSVFILSFKNIAKWRFNKTSLYLSFVFLLIVIISALLNKQMSAESLLEISRYILSFLTLIYFLNLRISSTVAAGFIKLISVLVVLQSLVMYLAIEKLNLGNYHSPFFQIDLFLEGNETRLSGFFSDPNKFLCFFLFLIIFFFIFSKGLKKGDYPFLIIMSIGSLLSFSRTAIVALLSFYLLFLIYRIFSTQKVLRNFFLIFSAVSIIFLLFLDTKGLNESLNNIFKWLAQMLGREHTAEINSDLANDSRLQIWKLAGTIISKNPFLGHGPLSYSYLLPYPTHNTLVNLLLDFGTFGALVYFFLFKEIFRFLPLFISFSLFLVPLLFLDLGNFRLSFVLLGIISSIYKERELLNFE